RRGRMHRSPFGERTPWHPRTLPRLAARWTGRTRLRQIDPWRIARERHRRALAVGRDPRAKRADGDAPRDVGERLELLAAEAEHALAARVARRELVVADGHLD